MVTAMSAVAQSWRPLQNQPTFFAGPCFLMTDGSVLVQEGHSRLDWWKLTPDSNNRGSYATGTWSQMASFPPEYAPVNPSSGVLKDGRFLVVGAGEGNLGTGGFQVGYLYDLAANAWTRMSSPNGGGDQPFSILSDGTVFAAGELWNPVTSTWRLTGPGNLGVQEEEQASLLPDGTMVMQANGIAQKYVPSIDQWVSAGTLPGVGVAGEDGPSVLMYNGKLLTMIGDEKSYIYTPPAVSTDPGMWVVGPSLPVDPALGQLIAADAAAALLPNGNVLCAAGGAGFSGVQFAEFNGTSWTEVPNPPGASSDTSESTNLLVLPSGEVLMTDFSQDVEIYTPAGTFQSAWRPTITSAPAHITPTLDFTVQGTQLNGWSQAEGHADDVNNATNYPLMRIINRATGHWFYCRTHDHSSMGVATGSTIESTQCNVPYNTEPGYSYLELEVNGIDSPAIPVMVDARMVRSLVLSLSAAPSATVVTGTVTLIAPSAAGGTTINLSSNSPAALVPSTVVVPAGATQATFPITTVNASYVPLQTTITAAYSTQSPNTASLTVNPGNYAQFVSQNTPASLGLNQSFSVALQFKNAGSTTWDTLHLFKLRSLSPINNTTWGFNRILLQNSPVAPGGTGLFTATITAPGVTGTYNFAWQLIQDDIGMAFGPGSPNVAVNVFTPPDGAHFVSQTGVPATIVAGATFKPSITFQNVGTNTWSSPSYVLRSRAPYNNTNWGTATILLPLSTAPSNFAIFKPALTAPAVPGAYNFQWSMMNLSSGTLFGEISPNLVIVVQTPPDNALYVSETTIPTQIAPGAAFQATISMKNSGTSTWDSTYGLHSANPALNTRWGTSSIPVSGTVVPGNTFAFAGSFTAPITPGAYHFIWQMAKGSTPFGQQTPDVVINVVTDASHYVSTSSQPATIVAGKDFYVQYTMQNIGTTTWASASGYAMMSVNPNGNTTWNRPTISLPFGSFAPGASALITGLCMSPITAGTYTMQWQLAKSGVPFGDKTPLASIVVTLGPDDAKYSTQTTIPTTITHSTQFTATITMKNLGTATWAGPTYSLVPVGTSPFGVASIPAPSTAQFAFGAFTATFTAPATPGTYTFQMRMADGTTKFGQATIPVTVTVT